MQFKIVLDIFLNRSFSPGFDLFDGISTPNGLFNVKIWLIS